MADSAVHTFQFSFCLHVLSTTVRGEEESPAKTVNLTCGPLHLSPVLLQQSAAQAPVLPQEWDLRSQESC